MFIPVAGEITEYSGKGRFTTLSFRSLNFPTKVTKVVGKVANYSLAELTWRSYKTAANHIRGAEFWSGITFELPFTPRMTVAYVAYMLGKPKPCKGETVEKYFSGLRMLHLEEGFNPPCLRSNLVKHILTGAKKMDAERERLEGKAERLAVDVEIMRLLKQAIKCKQQWSIAKKRLVWCICCLAFNGSFRIHELLSREEETFDPTQTLLVRDVKELEVTVGGEDMMVIQVHLKAPKEQKLSEGVKVEVFPCPESDFCPLRALRKWKKVSCVKQNRGQVLFRKEDGRSYTGRQFNEDLKKLLSKHMDYKKGKILAHSFRSGLASCMAKLGYTDQEIQSMGRWSSQAFLTYVSTARLKRSRMALEMSRRLATM